VLFNLLILITAIPQSTILSSAVWDGTRKLKQPALQSLVPSVTGLQQTREVKRNLSDYLTIILKAGFYNSDGFRPTSYLNLTNKRRVSRAAQPSPTHVSLADNTR